jgi:phosphonatase-like hydrolase
MNNLSDVYDDAPIFPQKNAEELFKLLQDKGVIIVLNTGYDSRTANLLLDKLKWKVGDTIDQLVTASDVTNGRPNPDMIHFAMKHFNIADTSMVAKIGDSIIDIEEGKNANCGIVLGITSGAHTVDQLQSANPDGVIDDLLECLTFIQ